MSCTARAQDWEAAGGMSCIVRMRRWVRSSGVRAGEVVGEEGEGRGRGGMSLGRRRCLRDHTLTWRGGRWCELSGRQSGRKSAEEGAAWEHLVPGGSGEFFAAGVEMH
jgi:hypothetical protein